MVGYDFCMTWLLSHYCYTFCAVKQFLFTFYWPFSFLLLFYLNKCFSHSWAAGERYTMTTTTNVHLSIVYCGNISLFTKKEEFCILRGQIGNLFFCCIRNCFHCIFVILLLSFDNRHHSICLLFAVSPSLSVSHHNLYSFQSVFCIVWHTPKRQRRRPSTWHKMCPFTFVVSLVRMLLFQFFLFSLFAMLKLLDRISFFSICYYYWCCCCLPLCTHVNVSISTIFGVWQQWSKSKRNKRWNLGFVPEEIHSTSLR